MNHLKFLWVGHPVVQSIVNGLCRFTTYEDAISKLQELREWHIRAKLLPDEEVRVDYEIFWIRGLNLTGPQEAEGYMGHFFRIYILTDEETFRLAHQQIDRELNRHPQRKSMPSDVHPNWGDPVLRRLKGGKRVVYPTLEEAKEVLARFSDKYSKAILATDTKCYCMVYKKWNDSVRIEKWIVRIAEEKSGYYMYMEPNHFKKEQGWVNVTSNQEIEGLTERAKAFATYLFGDATTQQEGVAQIVMRNVENRENRRVFKMDESRYLYHYTSFDALSKILDSGEIWLTDLRFVNDTSEIEHGRHTIIAHMETQQQSEDSLGTLCNNVLKYLHGPEHDFRPSYGFSFSEASELSNQWLAYGDNGNGVAIGFDFAGLANIWGHNPNFFFSKVHYIDERKSGIVESILRDVDDDQFLDVGGEEVARALAVAFDALAPFFKHNGFSAEREWRITHSGDDCFDEKIRRGAKSDICYISAELEGDLVAASSGLIGSVVMAASGGEARKRDLICLLKKYSMENVEIKTSTLPLF